MPVPKVSGASGDFAGTVALLSPRCHPGQGRRDPSSRDTERFDRARRIIGVVVMPAVFWMMRFLPTAVISNKLVLYDLDPPKKIESNGF